MSSNSNSIREAFQRPQWLDEQLYPFQSRFVEVEGNRIDLEKRLQSLEGMPALLIFSDAASIVKMGWLQRMEQLFPQHRSIVLHGSHHFPQEYDPASVVTAIRSWLDETIAL